jgi:hypothetical protein
MIPLSIALYILSHELRYEIFSAVSILKPSGRKEVICSLLYFSEPCFENLSVK